MIAVCAFLPLAAGADLVADPHRDPAPSVGTADNARDPSPGSEPWRR